MVQLRKKKPSLAAEKAKTKRGLKAGDAIVCEHCPDVHRLIPCTNPDYDYLFYNCGGVLRLARFQGVPFVKKARG